MRSIHLSLGCTAAVLAATVAGCSQPAAGGPDERCRSLDANLLRAHGVDPASLQTGDPAVPGFPACTWQATIDGGSLTATMDVPHDATPELSATYRDIAYCLDAQCPDDAVLVKLRSEQPDEPLNHDAVRYLLVRRDHWPELAQDLDRQRTVALDELVRRLAEHIALAE